MEQALAFLGGILSVLIVINTIKVFKSDSKVKELQRTVEDLEYKQSTDNLGERIEDLEERMDDCRDSSQQFNDLVEEDISDIHDDIDELRDSIELLEDDSHPPISDGGSTELKAQIEKLKKAFKTFKKVMSK